MGAAVSAIEESMFCKHCGEYNPKHCENRCIKNPIEESFECKFCGGTGPHSLKTCKENPNKDDIDTRCRRCVRCLVIDPKRNHVCMLSI